MKKKLLALLSMPLFVQAAQQAESMSDEMMADFKELPQKIEMGWKDMIMMRWSNMSLMYKMIVLVLVGFVVFWVVCRFMKCGSCRCGSGSCNCHK